MGKKQEKGKVHTLWFKGQGGNKISCKAKSNSKDRTSVKLKVKKKQSVKTQGKM